MANAKLQFKVLTLSESAAHRLRDIMANAERPLAALKIGVKNGGCAGMSYTMDWVDVIGPYDEVIEDQGVRLVIDPKAVMFLIGTQMDFRNDKMSSGFVFNNPNQTSACGCGESVAIEPAKPDQASLQAHPSA
ncbi:MAG: iron-sulfur cluster assembly accessory protein [Alphaproteobacteria bacterium]|nr:iron-sulfur cluster assembly accessory protein [Alphaproteobacteria bacterium]